MVAAEGRIATLLQAECPNTPILPLPGYRISYSKRSSWLVFSLISRLPAAIRTYFRSAALVKKWVKEHSIDVVISDNRPELHDCGAVSVYITHQLSVKTGWKLMDRLATGVHRSFINGFNQCWVPDEKGSNNLAGQLSHPSRMPRIPVKYLGCLSRFYGQPEYEKEFDLLVLLSGPEPQRSILEKKLIEQLGSSNMRSALVRGLPGGSDEKIESSRMKIFDHLPADQLQKLILSSEIIIARCGYSTVMDLSMMGKKAILIPTPGQGEQEYLGQWLMKKGFFYIVTQNKVNIESDVRAAACFQFTQLNLKRLNEDVIIEALSEAGINHA